MPLERVLSGILASKLATLGEDLLGRVLITQLSGTPSLVSAAVSSNQCPNVEIKSTE